MATPAEEDEELRDIIYEEEGFIYHLIQAQQHSQQALDLIYHPDGPKRSLWYRMVLGRAQSILMSLTVRELGNRKE